MCVRACVCVCCLAGCFYVRMYVYLCSYVFVDFTLFFIFRFLILVFGSFKLRKSAHSCHIRCKAESRPELRNFRRQFKSCVSCLGNRHNAVSWIMHVRQLLARRKDWQADRLCASPAPSAAQRRWRRRMKRGKGRTLVASSDLDTWLGRRETWCQMENIQRCGWRRETCRAFHLENW